MTTEEIGKYIKFLRIKHRYSQTQLAVKCNISRGKLARIENNKRPYLINSLLEILEVLNEKLYIAPDNGYTRHIINEVAKNIEQAILLNYKPTSTQTYGWVYIVKEQKNNNSIKIGFTKQGQVQDRIDRIIGIQYPEEKVELFYARLTSNPIGIEKTLHDEFKNNNIRNEWFDVNCEIVKKKMDYEINKIDTPHMIR